MVEAHRIGIGSTVLVKFPSGKTATFTVVASSRHADPARGAVSCESPLGKALLGKTKGEIAEYTVNGRAFRAEILKISSKNLDAP